jgi:hypothetical protein
MFWMPWTARVRWRSSVGAFDWLDKGELAFGSGVGSSGGGIVGGTRSGHIVGGGPRAEAAGPGRMDRGV